MLSAESASPKCPRRTEGAIATDALSAVLGEVQVFFESANSLTVFMYYENKVRFHPF